MIRWVPDEDARGGACSNLVTQGADHVGEALAPKHTELGIGECRAKSIAYGVVGPVVWQGWRLIRYVAVASASTQNASGAAL